MLLPEGFKYLLLGAVVTLGLLGIGATAWSEEKASSGSSLEEEKTLGRDPFSLPAGVKFLKKEKGAEAGAGASSTETEIDASHVNGIFQSGNKAMASVNGQWLEEGSWVGEEQVVEIKEDKVVLAGKKGGKRELPFKGGAMDLLKVTEWVKPKAGEKK